MWGSRRQERQFSALDVVDGLFFTYSALASMWLAYVLLRDGVRPGWSTLLLVVFWVFFTYLVLPRMHRILTRIYVPDYFIGRTRTSDGLLGDPVNLGLLGSEQQVHASMGASGWTRAHDVGVRSSLRIVASTLRRHSYPEAPVSPLTLFDRRQDFAYQKEVADSPSRRHHVRFWRCPEDWLLPGGFEVDWLAAGTYDRGVGISLFTLQVTHRIEENTDVERDFIMGSLVDSVPLVDVTVIENFSSGYHARNGGGDRIETDGDLPMIDLRNVVAPDLTAPEGTDSRGRRPVQTVLGAVLAIVHGTAILVLGLLLLLLSLDVFYLVVVVVGLVDIALAVAVLAGRNWARLCLMSACALATAVSFLGTVGQHGSPVGLGSLPAVGGGILVLLALSSHRAREYATSGRDHRASRQVQPERAA